MLLSLTLVCLLLCAGHTARACGRFEKQDAVKVVQKRLRAKSSLNDFYNIVFERPADDPAGYDTFFVDPVRKCVL